MPVNFIIKTLAIFGGMALICFIVVIVCLIKDTLEEVAHHKHIEYIQKHRFDKPPLAKCYCIDCRSWNKFNQNCGAHDGWRTADDWFCWEAEPRVNFEDYI